MTILLADDHTMMREGLRAILEKPPAFDVVGEASNGREAVSLALRLAPKIVLMDLSMPDLNGVDATRQIVAATPNVRVIGLSVSADRRSVLAMFSAGARGYVLKNAASDELRRAIGVVLAGPRYVSPLVADTVLESAIHKGVEPRALSSREREIVQLLAEGHTSKEIATTLRVAVSTIETHRRQIMRKLDVRSVAELTKYAIREGLTSLPDFRGHFPRNR